MPALLVLGVTSIGALAAGWIGSQWRDKRYQEYTQSGVMKVTKPDDILPWAIAAGALYIAYKK